MPLRSYRPTSPGMRETTRSTFEEITTDEPHKPLTERLLRRAGTLFRRRRDLLELVVKRTGVGRRERSPHRCARVKHDAGIDPIDDGLMAEHGDMNIEAPLDESVGRVHRHALRPSRSEMGDHEGQPFFLPACRGDPILGSQGVLRRRIALVEIGRERWHRQHLRALSEIGWRRSELATRCFT